MASGRATGIKVSSKLISRFDCNFGHYSSLLSNYITPLSQLVSKDSFSNNGCLSWGLGISF